MHNTRPPLAHRQRGFTLTEVLVAMALIAVITLVVMGAMGPWIGFKQKLDTERRLQDIKNGFMAIYEENGMAIEAQVSGRFREFVTSVPVADAAGERRCASQQAAFSTNATVFSDSPAQIALDGYVNPWCIFVSQPIREIRDGVSLWYRNVNIVSGGEDGILDAATTVDASGNLTIGGDDIGVTVSGREVQAPKLKETLRRLNRVAQFYESYFTSRYMSYPDRDITRYYFADGAVGSTGSLWVPSATLLGPVGIGGPEVVTPWETANAIELNNFDQSAGGITVRTPETTGTGVLPYTALLRAQVPSPAGAPEYAVQAVVGNY